MALLCPATLGDASGALVTRFAGDAAARAQLVEMLPPAHPAVADGQEGLALLQLQLDQNTFADGVFPLAAIFNHRCEARRGEGHGRGRACVPCAAGRSHAGWPPLQLPAQLLRARSGGGRRRRRR